MKALKVILPIVFCSVGLHIRAQSISIPLGGNAFSSKHNERNRTVTNKGLENWTDATEQFTVYLRVSKPGSIILSVKDISVTGKSTLQFAIGKEAKKVIFNPNQQIQNLVGTWTIKDTGYVALKIKGLEKTGSSFPSISAIQVSGTAIDQNTAYVKDNKGNFFYWGRRGPSVHLNYLQPENIQAEWYYNEVTVPVENDVIGSYFMANGFAEGYFGMQVNGPNERRILFSVWSPFATDDPKSIPDSLKIKMIKKGQGVQAGEFGNEGAGGQSYLKYSWKAGSTYKFLLHGKPDLDAADSSTTYTAYFFAPELNEWKLIAQFKRPKTKTYLKRFHSFLENFSPVQGDLSRKVWFDNQWICDDLGNWVALTTARFTTDNTGVKGYRMDFSGGIDNGHFFLRNCGFFSDFTFPKTFFERHSANKKPQIDFNKLPDF
ncbi:DUF3472 domain-containing protein [Pedobacter sp. AW1-32]|uniref:DUF3472 domain-containing protein n=1 Tax=Pedobacter sp. AW1-32 TaxID=3383026 RepID=UPI003FEDDFB6